MGIGIHGRDDIGDRAWKVIEAHLPGKKGMWGGVAKNNSFRILSLMLCTVHKKG